MVSTTLCATCIFTPRLFFATGRKCWWWHCSLVHFRCWLCDISATCEMSIGLYLGTPLACTFQKTKSRTPALIKGPALSFPLCTAMKIHSTSSRHTVLANLSTFIGGWAKLVSLRVVICLASFPALIVLGTHSRLSYLGTGDQLYSRQCANIMMSLWILVLARQTCFTPVLYIYLHDVPWKIPCSLKIRH